MSYLSDISHWLVHLVAVYILFECFATVSGFMLTVYRRIKKLKRVKLGTQMVLLVIEGVVIWFIAEWIENPVIGFVEGYPYWALVVAMHLTADFVVSYEYAVRGKVKWTGPGIIWLASFLLFGLAEYLTPLPK